MQNRRKRRTGIVVTIFLVVAVGAIVGGCSRETRHEILTFFFTGVPPLDAPQDGAGTKPAGATDAQAAALAGKRKFETALRQKEIERERRLPWVHGPYGANDCARCHAFGASRVFRKSAAKTTVPTLGSAAPGRLIMPKQELCFGCHTDKNVETADARGFRIHGPVAAGECVACHSPHAAQRRYMLHDKSNTALCGQCHDPAGIARRAPIHKNIAKSECTNCHDPHMGRPMMILRSQPVQAGLR